MASPPTDPIDIWRSAKLLLQELEDQAPEHAQRRISELTMQGDVVGAAVWGEILAAMAALRSQKPPLDTPKH